MPSSIAHLLANVQGDILLDGLPKRNECFFFFTIDEVEHFVKALPNLADEITNCLHTADSRHKIKLFKQTRPELYEKTLPIAGVNIAFSMKGLGKMETVLKPLDLTAVGDTPFSLGMKAGANGLNDPFHQDSNEPKYEPEFMHPEKLHGLLLVTGDTPVVVDEKLECIRLKLKGSVSEVKTIHGKVRPGQFKGHEHFGFLDGISQPAIEGVDTHPFPGQDSVAQGVILCGREGDKSGRPTWMTDGSFMCFRKLEQRVLEWNKMLVDDSNKLGTWSDQLGARLIGRWHSGCPVLLSPDFDNTDIGKDPNKNSHFEFKHGDNLRCPAGAHIRKTYPRGDLKDEVIDKNRIIRRGIPYGDEIEESPHGERGLLFVCYQSDLANGFEFLQTHWANNSSFFGGPDTGLDAVIGQSNTQPAVGMAGLDPQDLNRLQVFRGINHFVIPQGGEYFFMPSITALRTTLADLR